MTITQRDNVPSICEREMLRTLYAGTNHMIAGTKTIAETPATSRCDGSEQPHFLPSLIACCS